MDKSNSDNDVNPDEVVSESPDADDEKSLDYLLDKPPSARDYFKALFYFVIVVLVGVLIAVLVFLANQ